MAALDGPQECVKNIVEEYKKRRDLIVKRLNEIELFSVNKPPGAFYVFLRIFADLRFPDFVKQLIDKAKVAVMPGTAFSIRGEKYTRISFASSMENISEVMDRVQRLTKQITKH